MLMQLLFPAPFYPVERGSVDLVGGDYRWRRQYRDTLGNNKWQVHFTSSDNQMQNGKGYRGENHGKFLQMLLPHNSTVYCRKT